MFDTEWWAISRECFSTKEHKDISFYETHSSKPRLSDVLVHRSFFRDFSFTVHSSLLIAPKPVSYVLMSNPFGEICAICVSKNFGRCTQTSLPLITQNSPLIAHHSLLKNLSYLRHRRAVVHICQKTRKGDFGPSEENPKITNPLIVKQIQNHEKPFENTQKKDLSVSWVLLKSFRSNT